MSWQPQGWQPGGTGGGGGSSITLPGLDITRQKLLADVDAWLARDDVATGNGIDSILHIAEDYLSTDVRLVAQERSATLQVDARRVAAPADYLTWRTVFVEGQRLEYMTPEAIRESRFWTGGGRQQFFSLEGHADGLVRFVFAPAGTLANPVTAELLYFGLIPPLINENDTNWLLRNHYALYLYATLRAAAEWIQEIELEARYKGKYEECIARINRSENRKRFGAGAKQSYNMPRTVV